MGVAPLPSSTTSRHAPPWLLATLGPLVAVAAVLLLPVIADASCASSGGSDQQTIRSAPTAFIGTVTGLSNGDRVATVRVDDVWRGGGIPSSVEVVGTPDLNAAATSVDRTFAAGTQYLFVPNGGGPAHFTDNSCTATQPYSANLSGLRPADAPGTPPPPTGAPTQAGSTFPLVLVVAGVVVVLVAAVGAIAAGLRVKPSA
ncbi:MAG: hypothetical protein JF886_10915 [Candidatus Dormibacteraeota bacterium]|uniref:Uncharacterized protein n=1 Tax=Candidatus Aeolococcus gillhamiae TaxID=3127015 RepID=A0A934K153_9BACT|nr:hypothetical protein [Candidatus Dormibacteraeota bacterium]